jgi:ferredoxin-NADP reductase
LDSVCIQTPQTKLVANLDEAEAFARDIGYPVVLKMSSPELLHKRDVGGVITHINDRMSLSDGFDTLHRKISHLDDEIKEKVQIQIQKEVPNGIEVIVGTKHDPTFGPVLLFGAGGTLAEMISDRNLHLLPMDKGQAKKLVENSKIHKLLAGYRGDQPYALDKLYEVIMDIGNLALNLPSVADLEVNPVIVTMNDVWSVDAKVVLKGKPPKKVSGPQFKVAKVLEHKNLATTYHYFTCESEEPLNYKPGQYISVKVSPERINCYSIAGHSDPHKFNLLVDTIPGGPGSKFFEAVKVGDRMSYLGPFGIFTLNMDDGADNLLFFATGSGCSPVKDMLEAALKEHKTTKQVRLYLGLRSSADVFLEDHFRKLEQEYPNFKFRMAADKDPTGTWHGHVGYVTDLLKEDFPDASKCAAYMCGSPPMMNSTTKLLKELGCPEERIYSEKF